MSKTFRNAPNPKALSPDQITAFESGGPGHDTREIGKAGTHESANATSREQENETKRVEPTKRFCIDMPATAHRRFKTACAASGVTMLDEVTGFILQRTGELETALSGDRETA